MPPADPPERASVLLSAAAAPDAAVVVAAAKELGHEAKVVAAEGQTIAVEVAAVGRLAVGLVRAPLEGAEAAFRRGLSAILSDEPLAAHAAQWQLELVPDKGVSRVAALDALARFGVALARAAARGSGCTSRPGVCCTRRATWSGRCARRRRRRGCGSGSRSAATPPTSR